MRRLAVYEPPYSGAHHPGDAFGERLDELVARGRRDEAAEAWLAMTGTPRPLIASIKRGPGWVQRQALAHTLSRDLRLANGGQVPAARLGRINIPVLAMAGEASPAWATATTATLTGVLPQAVERVVAGQQHVPADGVIAPILAAFFADS